MKKTYLAHIQITFEGQIELTADDAIQAVEYLEKQFGMRLGFIQTSADDEEPKCDAIHWVFPDISQNKVTDIKSIEHDKIQH